MVKLCTLYSINRKAKSHLQELVSLTPTMKASEAGGQRKALELHSSEQALAISRADAAVSESS